MPEPGVPVPATTAALPRGEKRINTRLRQLVAHMDIDVVYDVRIGLPRQTTLVVHDGGATLALNSEKKP